MDELNTVVHEHLIQVQVRLQTMIAGQLPGFRCGLVSDRQWFERLYRRVLTQTKRGTLTAALDGVADRLRDGDPSSRLDLAAAAVMVQFQHAEQVCQGRFGALVDVGAVAVQSIVTAAGLVVVEWHAQIVSA